MNKIVHGVNCDCRNKLQCEDAEEAELHGTVRGVPVRTHPAEGGEGRELTELADRMFSLSTWLHARGWEKEADMAEDAMSKFASLAERAAPPPQPVAPERGEAKAVAPDHWRLREWAEMFSDQGFVDAADDIVAAADFIESIGYCEDCGGSGWHTERGNDGAPCGDSPCDTCNPNGDAEREAQRTPQPPPAPMFRDPTIEDALLTSIKRDLSAMNSYADGFSKPSAIEMGVWAHTLTKVLNAIGAKVETIK